MNEIRLYKSRWKAIRLLLLTIPFVSIAVYDLFNHLHMLPASLAWLILIFFSIIFTLGIFNLLDRKPQIIINETGIFNRTSYKDFINWDTIDHAYWKTVYSQPFVCLIIKDEYKHLIKGKHKLKEVWLTLGFAEVNINLSSISNIDQEKLTGLIIRLTDANPIERSKLLTHKYKLDYEHSA